MGAIGKITHYDYFDIPKRLQSKVNRAEEYALAHYEKHKKDCSELYREAEFEIRHNYVYDVVEKRITKEEYEEKVKLEFVYSYTEKMIWKDIWDSRGVSGAKYNIGTLNNHGRIDMK